MYHCACCYVMLNMLDSLCAKKMIKVLFLLQRNRTSKKKVCMISELVTLEINILGLKYSEIT